MKTRTALYIASFAGLAATTAVALAGVAQPSIAPLLLVAVLAASLAGSPGLFDRRLWPLALALIPIGALILVRAQVDVPSDVHGWGAQLAYVAGQVQAGMHTYQYERFPLAVLPGDGLAVFASLVVYVAVGAAAFCALSLRLAVPAIAILLVMLGFGLTADRADHLLWAPVVFLLLAGCVLMFSRSLARDRWRAADLLAGSATALIATVFALSLMGATSVVASAPLWDWRTWGIAGRGDTLVGFDWMQSYLRLLDEPGDAVVMKVRSPVATYWRANALTAFDGNTWFNGSSYTQMAVTTRAGAPQFVVPARPPEPPGRVVTQSFEVVSTLTDHLFTGGTPRSVLTDGRVKRLWVTDAQALRLDQPVGPRIRYTVTAVVPQLRASDLVGRGRSYPPDVVLSSTSVPFPVMNQSFRTLGEREWNRLTGRDVRTREWRGLYRLNQTILDGAADPVHITLRIEKYLRKNYAYSLRPPESDMSSPYAEFLFDTKTGYCQHFAGAMAALLRFNGIPSRVAVGFAAGDRSVTGTYIVTRKDAHAWVEAYFPGVGWVSFDPTPGHTMPLPGASSASVGFVNPHVATRGAGGSGALPAAQPHGADPGGAAAAARRPAAGPTGAVAASRRLSPWALTALTLAALLVAWPAVRLGRRALSVRRGTPAERLGTSLGLLRDQLLEQGVAAPASLTLDETAVVLRERFGVDASAALGRAQAVLFGGVPATAADVAAVGAVRRELGRAARARHGGRLRACLSLYGIRAGARA